MANPEHLRILEQGVDTWNKWRDGNQHVYPDLSRANLVGYDLVEINFSKTDLNSAQLDGANLTNTDFSDAFLSHTVFREANLNGAYMLNARMPQIHSERANYTNATLMGASLRGAKLSDVNFSGVKFWITNLAQARLENTDFTNAVMGYSFLEFLDLSTVIGLETVEFIGPLSIGIETIYLSKGKIPRNFLYNARVPEKFIDYMPSLTGKAFEYYACFISFTEVDDALAVKLRNDLMSQGIHCWRWKEDARMGHDMWASIDSAIRKYDKLIVICSEASLHSPPVLREIERALQKEDELIRQDKPSEVLFSIRVDDYIFNNWKHPRKPNVVKKNVGDFRDWQKQRKYEEVFSRLVNALNKKYDEDS